MDDITMNSGDSDSNLFPADTNEQFPFSLDDKLPDNILEDVNILDAFDKDALDQDLNDSSSRNEPFETVNETNDTTNVPTDTEFALPDAGEDGMETDVVRETEDGGNGDTDDQPDHNESEQVMEHCE